MSIKSRREGRLRRHRRIRFKVKGTADSPRLCVFRSLNHMYAQIIDDSRGQTIVSASTLDPQLKEEAKNRKKREAAQLVGALVAQRAREKGIARVTLDRAGYKYFGRVQALAEAARKAGLEL